MSIADAMKFVETVAGDEKLLSQLEDVDRQGLVALGGQHGLTFSLEEVSEVLSSFGDDGTLGDDDLEAVAGGLSLRGTAGGGKLAGGYRVSQVLKPEQVRGFQSLFNRRFITMIPGRG